MINISWVRVHIDIKNKNRHASSSIIHFTVCTSSHLISSNRRLITANSSEPSSAWTTERRAVCHPEFTQNFHSFPNAPAITQQPNNTHSTIHKQIYFSNRCCRFQCFALLERTKPINKNFMAVQYAKLLLFKMGLSILCLSSSSSLSRRQERFTFRDAASKRHRDEQR